ncbi:hypothetical protein N7451_012789 [Penicillium sp. IBT 35674x]|nr:hypothetical protein N7451_012789 [Penicillium sp. IBT 35674x]
MASGSIAELMTYVDYLPLKRNNHIEIVPSRNEEYTQKVEHSIQPVTVTFSSPLDDKCRAVVSKIEELSNEFATIKFYQVDVRKHAMLSSAFHNTKLPVIVFIKNGANLMTLDSDDCLPKIREGLQALQMASE